MRRMIKYSAIAAFLFTSVFLGFGYLIATGKISPSKFVPKSIVNMLMHVTGNDTKPVPADAETF